MSFIILIFHYHTKLISNYNTKKVKKRNQLI